MEKLLCPSMMCADFGCLDREIQDLEDSGADIFHLDLMDGIFVPNYGMGLQDIEYIVKCASIPCDIHMMVTNPDRYVERFAAMGVSIIYIHPEADLHAPRTLQKVIDAKAHPGIAINPGTSFSTIEPLLNLAEYVLVMTVNPGFASQSYIPFVEHKIDKLLQYQSDYNYKILIDGACSLEVIGRLSAKGVNGFILGTKSLFDASHNYSNIMRTLKAL